MNGLRGVHAAILADGRLSAACSIAVFAVFAVAVYFLLALDAAMALSFSSILGGTTSR